MGLRCAFAADRFGPVKLRCSVGLLGAGLALFPAAASAATWGSFDTSRMAYAAGALEGSAHDDLRQLIADAGDTVATGTDTLTADYLDGVDVFYTGMLSGGTGMTAGVIVEEEGCLHGMLEGEGA